MMQHPHYLIADLIREAQKKSGLPLSRLEKELGIGHDVLASALRRKGGLYGQVTNKLRNFLGFDYDHERLVRLIQSAEAEHVHVDYGSDQ